jgi:DNA processing protein
VSDDGCPVWTARRGEPGYPAALLDLGPDAPHRIHGCGNPALAGRLQVAHTVTIVGSRRPSSYGLRVAEELGCGLASAGLVVVSGMALGIDAAAHRGALAAGGLTVAVLGSGANVPYPPSERRLYDRIVSTGAVISEASPGKRPERGAFPKRNRLMAALGAITVVVEAARSSGSLHTVRQALDLGRPVGAVPGQITSKASEATNDLIADGAFPVRGPQDVLDRLLGVGGQAVGRSGASLDGDLAQVAEAVELGGGTGDAVAGATGLDAGEAAIALARLELLGYVETDASGRYVRTALVAPDP